MERKNVYWYNIEKKKQKKNEQIRQADRQTGVYVIETNIWSKSRYVN